MRAVQWASTPLPHPAPQSKANKKLLSRIHYIITQAGSNDSDTTAGSRSSACVLASTIQSEHHCTLLLSTSLQSARPVGRGLGLHAVVRNPPPGGYAARCACAASRIALGTTALRQPWQQLQCLCCCYHHRRRSPAGPTCWHNALLAPAARGGCLRRDTSVHPHFAAGEKGAVRHVHAVRQAAHTCTTQGTYVGTCAACPSAPREPSAPFRRAPSTANTHHFP